MKIVAKPVSEYTYSIEDMTTREAAAVALILGRCNKKLSQATFDIYAALITKLKANGVSIDDFGFDKD